MMVWVRSILGKNSSQILKTWALGHRAGALQALGRRSEAAYLFAVVFRYCPSKRKQAFESFKIQTETEWQECLSFCKNPQERAALYAIRASYNNARALDDMYELYKLDPKNEHLDMLLIRKSLLNTIFSSRKVSRIKSISKCSFLGSSLYNSYISSSARALL